VTKPTIFYFLLTFKRILFYLLKIIIVLLATMFGQTDR
jgi:hypothetical protein